MKPGFRLGLMGAAGLLAVVLTLPFLLPASIYKSEIEQNVTRATGRNFVISGPLRLILFPVPGLRADNVALANAPSGRATYLLRAASVRIDARLVPLLSGRIEVSQITLDRPDI